MDQIRVDPQLIFGVDAGEDIHPVTLERKSKVPDYDPPNLKEVAAVFNDASQFFFIILERILSNFSFSNILMEA